MKVYHGSLERVENPEIPPSNRIYWLMTKVLVYKQNIPIENIPEVGNRSNKDVALGTCSPLSGTKRMR